MPLQETEGRRHALVLVLVLVLLSVYTTGSQPERVALVAGVGTVQLLEATSLLARTASAGAGADMYTCPCPCPCPIRHTTDLCLIADE